MALHGSILLLVQIGLILALSRAMGLLFLRLRQPQVIGEMVAGIMLGPSLLGWLWPAGQATLFPPDGTELLHRLSELGVILFLFLIGLELDPNLVRKRGQAAVAVSISSIALPFLLGAGLTVYLYARQRFDDPGRARLLATALFMGAAMAITAFPVLARILAERNLHRSNVGVLAIACAAANDAAAWVILAFVVAVARATGPLPAIRTLGLAVLYVAAMFLLVRPFLRRLQLSHERQGRLSQNVIAVVFLLILASAWVSSWVGIHAMFGAFLMGAIMPKGTQFVRTLSEKLEDFTVVLLLPLFFAYSGLKTQIGLLDSGGQWLDTGLIVLAACLGKFVGSAGAARACGIPWREASAVGVLMNTRGLMELVILNVGMELGVVTPAVFAMMVLMALVTTGLTTPLLHVVYPRRLMQVLQGTAAEGATGAPAVPAAPALARRGVLSVLIPVADPSSGGPLLRLAELLTAGERTDRADRRIFALHLRRPRDQDAYRAAVGAAEPITPAEPLRPLLEHATSRRLSVEPITLSGRNLSDAIAAVARERRVDLVLMGFHRPVFGNALLGGTVHRVLTGVPTDVGVFVDRGFLGARRVLVPYLGSPHDRLALDLAARLGRNTQAEVTVLHVVPPGRRRGRPLNAGGEVEKVFRDPSQPAPVHFRVVEADEPVEAALREAAGFDLIIVAAAEEWGTESHRFGFRTERIAEGSGCSLLIVRKHDRGPVPAGDAPHGGAGTQVEPSAPKTPAETAGTSAPADVPAVTSGSVD